MGGSRSWWVMTFFTKLLLLTVIIVAGIYALGQNGQEDHNWGVIPVGLQKMQLDSAYVVLPNNTWVPFFFTNVGSWAFPQFQAILTQISAFTTFTVVDAFCGGDAFTVYYFFKQFNISLTGRDPAGVASCSNYTLSPDAAIPNVAFYYQSLSTGGIGVSNITIVTRASPFSAGKGYIKAVYPP